MFKFIHHLFNPHCEQCRIDKQSKLELERLIHLEQSEEIRFNNSCESCETLRTQLAHMLHQNELLMQRLLEKPSSDVIVNKAPVPVTRPTTVPWATRRQMLEQEDRAKAVAMRGAAQPLKDTNNKGVQTIQEIEKELGVVDTVDGVNGNV